MTDQHAKKVYTMEDNVKTMVFSLKNIEKQLQETVNVLGMIEAAILRLNEPKEIKSENLPF